MAAKPVAEWRVEDVTKLLTDLELHAAVPAFKGNAVNGSDLLTLSDEDFKQELGLTTLQIRKIKKGLEAAQTSAAGLATTAAPAPAVGGPPPQLEAAAAAAAAPSAPPLPAALAGPPAAPASAYPAISHAPPAAPPAAAAAGAPVTGVPVGPAPPAPAAAAGGGAVEAKKRQAEELEAAAKEFKAKAAEAQQHAGTYGRATMLLTQAGAKLQGATKMLTVTQVSGAMGAVHGARRMGAVAMRPGPAPPGAMRMAARGPPMQNMAHTMVEMGTVMKANEAVKAAAVDIEEARRLLPTLPYIPEASVSSAKAGVFMGALAPGMAGSMMQMAQVQRGMESVKSMGSQVAQALDWTKRNQVAFEGQAAQAGASAAAKQAEADALRKAALDLI